GVQTVEGDAPAAAAEAVPSYMKVLHDLSQSAALTGPSDDFGGFGSIFPVFDPPLNFQFRLGLRSTDFFLSGTFKSGTKTIGFIRVPTMSPSNTNTALTQFVTEMLFFQQNTDGLVIDVMRNGGGSLCYTEALLQYLQTGQFYAANYYIRATDFWLSVFASSLQSAKDQAAPGWLIALYGAYVNDLQNSLKGNRALTGALPICSYSAYVTPSATLAFKKPIVVLTDEFTLSAAEFFSASLQDTGRATIVGQRTDGGGGNPGSYSAGVYSEGSTRVTRTYVVRSKASPSPGFPSTNLIENAGVYPDTLLDFMTADNLDTGGEDFVAKWTKSILDAIAKGN
ncbi:MAG: S41 family peptidase, partial [Bryobacteraceae bacterium]